jgi:uncharacterized protein YdaT
MQTRPTRRSLEQLTEPTRGIALQTLEQLLGQGWNEEEAIEVAFRQAEEWEASRAPEARTPVENERQSQVRSSALKPEDAPRRPAR